MSVSIKGGPAKSIKKLKSELAKSSGSGTWVRGIPKDDELKVRFLTEPTEWFKYEEHYDEDAQSFYPCIGDSCPGHSKGDRKPAKRYLANALDVDQERVIALKLPVTLANVLVSRYERYGTLMDRDFVLLREGSGLNTIYDADTEPKSKRNLKKYDLLDLGEVLVGQFEDAFGDDEEERPRKTKRLRAPVADDEEEEDEDEEPRRVSRTPKRTTSTTARRRRRRR